MTGTKTQGRKQGSRRAFFRAGGAVLGAGVATAVGATAAAPGTRVSSDEELNRLRQALASLDDREAIRQLHLAFAGFVEQQRYAAAAELFDEHAHLDLSGVRAEGKVGIAKLFEEAYRNQNVPVLHNAYRQSASQQRGDTVTVSEDRMHATAMFHTEAELCTPLEADCTVAAMARLQGNVADRRWESGRFEAKYVKAGGQWKVASLTWRSS